MGGKPLKESQAKKDEMLFTLMNLTKNSHTNILLYCTNKINCHKFSNKIKIPGSQITDKNLTS